MGGDRFDVKVQRGENRNGGNMNRPAKHVRRSSEVVYSPPFDPYNLKKTLETHGSRCSGFWRLPAELGFQSLPFGARLLLGENEFPSV